MSHGAPSPFAGVLRSLSFRFLRRKRSSRLGVFRSRVCGTKVFVCFAHTKKHEYVAQSARLFLCAAIVTVHDYPLLYKYPSLEAGVVLARQVVVQLGLVSAARLLQGWRAGRLLRPL